jgi:hypothetical protein
MSLTCNAGENDRPTALTIPLIMTANKPIFLLILYTTLQHLLNVLVQIAKKKKKKKKEIINKKSTKNTTENIHGNNDIGKWSKGTVVVYQNITTRGVL